MLVLGIFFASSAFAQLPSFPGAEGFGKFATGARGGSVYHVTTLADSGAGSFRDAVSVSGRTVVFDLGGVIDYQTPRYAPKPNITIAGQTAPGGGITIYGNGLSFSGSHNNVCRFIRVREGINGDSGTDAMTGGLTLNSGALLNFDLGTTVASDKIAVTGALALNGVLNLTNVAGFGAGTYTLITYTGALSGGGLTIGAHPLGYNYSVSTATANQVRLIVTAQTPPIFGSAVLNGNNLIFSGTGGLTNGNYFVLTTTNLVTPVSNWTRLATNLFDGSGNFIFTNLTDPNAGQNFFRLQLP